MKEMLTYEPICIVITLLSDVDVITTSGTKAFDGEDDSLFDW